jgi:hypothetical protein
VERGENWGKLSFPASHGGSHILSISLPPHPLSHEKKKRLLSQPLLAATRIVLPSCVSPRCPPAPREDRLVSAIVGLS